MAVVYIQEFAYKDWSTTNYDWAKEQIGDEPIAGLLAHTAGFDKDANVFGSWTCGNRGNRRSDSSRSAFSQ